MRPVHVVGAAVEPFGKHPDRGAAELGASAVNRLLDDTGLSPNDVDAGFVGSVYGGSLLAQRVLQRVGISGQPVFTVENACASGASAVHLGWLSIAAGEAECVVVAGTENLSALGGGALPLTTQDIEIAQGLIMPAAYAMRTQRYLIESGADISDIAAVSVKNRGNGARNPRAHFQKPVTVDQVLESMPVADPITLLQSCANSDGAAAVVLCSEAFAKTLGRPSAIIRASIVRSGVFHNAHRDMTWPDITARTAQAAFEVAALGPGDVDIVELHDAFAIAELLHLEAMGLAARHAAFRSLRDGEFEIGGRVAVSPSGGLLSRGHPVGASGASQIAECYWQLTGAAADLQVPGAEVALTHVTGGGIFGVDNGACSVHILTAA